MKRICIQWEKRANIRMENEMQGLILAAGMGTRLGAYTEEIPKVLVEVQNTPLIMYALERLYEQGVEETFIVVGYKKELIMNTCGDSYKTMRIIYVVNDIYETTNNIYSFYLATKLITQDVLMVEGDILFDRKILDDAVAIKRDCNIVVSKYNKATMNGTVIMSEHGVAKSLIIKKRQGADFDYANALKTVNIYYFRQEFLSKKLAPAVELYVSNGDLNNYYELIIGSLIYLGDDDIQTILVDEKEWFEIDDEHDLQIAINHGKF